MTWEVIVRYGRSGTPHRRPLLVVVDHCVTVAQAVKAAQRAEPGTTAVMAQMATRDGCFSRWERGRSW